MALVRPVPSPAHHTKHIPLLQYPFRSSCFHLAQLDNGATNGSALWLGAQCLSLYLADTLKPKSLAGRRPRAIELGSGIGLSALALCSMGWDVIATDLPDVISSVLSRNIECNASQLPIGSGTIEVRALDWLVPPQQWVWDNVETIALAMESSQNSPPQLHEMSLAPPFDLIISSDTLYSPDLAQALLRTLHALSMLTISSSLAAARPPPIYLCLERRDPTFTDRALSDARNVWDFMVERVPHKKVAKAMEKGNVKWDRDDWDGIEIWKLALNQPPVLAETT
ncbi:hypothetical protein B0H21DRAFT_683990 [Amylocystis lapponica]|nr:hypothetical protein B0H21DRAFT_683990 [Amylocystis lapponica]